jgi:flagellar biosynthesis/type III secretory pathway protein FliH
VTDDVQLARGEVRVETPEGHVAANVARSLETLARVAVARLMRDDDAR